MPRPLICTYIRTLNGSRKDVEEYSCIFLGTVAKIMHGKDTGWSKEARRSVIVPSAGLIRL